MHTGTPAPCPPLTLFATFVAMVDCGEAAQLVSFSSLLASCRCHPVIVVLNSLLSASAPDGARWLVVVASLLRVVG